MVQEPPQVLVWLIAVSSSVSGMLLISILKEAVISGRAYISDGYTCNGEYCRCPNHHYVNLRNYIGPVILLAVGLGVFAGFIFMMAG